MATPPPRMQRPSYTRAETLHCERSATEGGHGAKFWDVRASQTGSRRPTFTGRPQDATLSTPFNLKGVLCLACVRSSLLGVPSWWRAAKAQ